MQDLDIGEYALVTATPSIVSTKKKEFGLEGIGNYESKAYF